jgi:hypothetical protein
LNPESGRRTSQDEDRVNLLLDRFPSFPERYQVRKLLRWLDLWGGQSCRQDWPPHIF